MLRLLADENFDNDIVRGVLRRNSQADLAIAIQIKQCVFIQIFRFGHVDRSKFDVQGISILKMLYFYGTNLSKKAL